MEKVYLVYIEDPKKSKYNLKVYHGLEQVFDYFGVDGWVDGDGFSLFDNFEYYYMKKLTHGELKERMVCVVHLDDCFYHPPDPALDEELPDDYKVFKIPKLTRY